MVDQFRKRNLTKSITKYFATAGFVVNYYTSGQQENITEDLLQLKLSLR
jgi:hypothetical protein